MNKVAKFIERKLINPPHWVKDNLCYATITGSQSYGCETPTSDIDIASFCMLPREQLFPHERGSYVYGFKPVDKRYSQLPAFITVLGPVLLVAVLIERVSVDLTFTHMIDYIRLFIGKLLGYKND